VADIQVLNNENREDHCIFFDLRLFLIDDVGLLAAENQWTIGVFAIIWLLVQLPEIKQNKNLYRNIGINYEWYGFLKDYLWQDAILFILSIGTSMLFWKRHEWGKQEKARYLCLYSGLFSIFSLLIFKAASQPDSRNYWLLGLPIFFITSLLITTAVHYVTWQTKYVLLESMKIIFLGVVAPAINIYSNLGFDRSSHVGDAGSGLIFLFLTLTSTAIVFISSLIVNFALLKKKLYTI